MNINLKYLKPYISIIIILNREEFNFYKQTFCSTEVSNLNIAHNWHKISGTSYKHILMLLYITCLSLRVPAQSAVTSYLHLCEWILMAFWLQFAGRLAASETIFLLTLCLDLLKIFTYIHINSRLLPVGVLFSCCCVLSRSHKTHALLSTVLRSKLLPTYYKLLLD